MCSSDLSSGDHMFTGLIESSHYIINTTNDSNIFNNYHLRDLLDVDNIYIGGGMSTSSHKTYEILIIIIIKN